MTAQLLLDKLASQILNNLPTIHTPKGKQFKFLSENQVWCISRLKIPQANSAEELQKKCTSFPIPKAIYFSNKKKWNPYAIERFLGPYTPQTLFVPKETSELSTKNQYKNQKTNSS